MYVWFTASFVYYGLTLNSDTLIPGDLYVNFAIGGLLEFPAYVLTTLLLQFIGRRYPQSASYILCGLALLFNIASPTGLSKN
jgi:OCT family organic cation transporter-like MFS transporter 4/5